MHLYHRFYYCVVGTPSEPCLGPQMYSENKTYGWPGISKSACRFDFYVDFHVRFCSLSICLKMYK